MLTPLAGWTSLRGWLTRTIGLTPRMEKIQVSFRLGSSEELVEKVNVGKDEEVEAIVGRIEAAVAAHVQHFDPIPRAVVRVRGLNDQGRPIHSYGSDVVAVNEGGVDDEGSALPGGASVDGTDAVYRRILDSGGRVHDLKQAAADLPQFSLAAMLEHGRFTLGVMERTLNRSMQLNDHLATRNNELQERYLDAQLGVRRAQLEADQEKALGAISEQDKSVKRELVKMFAGNLNKGLDLMFASATGLPPDDPEMQKAFIAGYIRKNPDRAKELASSLGIGGSALDLMSMKPHDLKPMIMAYADKNPEEAAEFAAEMFTELTGVLERHSKAQQADAATRK